MKKVRQKIILFSIFMVIGCRQPNAHDPSSCFTPEQQASLLRQAVHYSTKLPPQATHESKFSPEFDWYYDAAAKEYDLRGCILKDGDYFFLMTRKARSIWPAREAIGGKLSVDKDFKMRSYEEIFRTWKMTEDSLNNRAFELFDLMVKGEDLTPYRSKYKGDRYIEFPDDHVYFSKEDRRWRDKSMDSLQVNR